MASDKPPSTSAEPDEDEGTEQASSSDEGSPVELLVTGREKRTTAGTRMSTLLEREGDDELELLFAEDEQEEDEEFEEEDAEDGSDAQLDSASSDEDQGPAKEDDDLEGEKELQRQTRVEQRKKRKAQDAFLKPGALKKRIRLETRPGSAGLPTTPAPTRKKSDRVSWLPTKDEGPVRASSRKQTVMNKEVVHSRLAASEKRRIHQLQVMEEAAKRKEASKPKVMTQAQRMEEAARTERSNAKSLNRWEAAEKKRLGEQKAKLEALHNRQLTGPVISWWSGMARWVNGKLGQVGWKSIKEAEMKGTHQAKQKDDLSMVKAPPVCQISPQNNHDLTMSDGLAPPSEPAIVDLIPSMQDETTETAQATTVAPPQDTEGFLDGIHYYASLPEQSSGTATLEQTQTYEHAKASPKPPEPVTPPALAPEVLSTVIPSSSSSFAIPNIHLSGRNVVILEDINTNVQRVPELQNHILLKRKGSVKGPKTIRELCEITEQPARYRDPRTGLPYADSYAYKEIQKLVNGGSRWSSLLGCYAGPTSSGARGVPERFWTNR
ncbi:MAG: hypothetical protein Q9216_000312 [Gyalolechia sp. 2 TL-2023]